MRFNNNINNGKKNKMKSKLKKNAFNPRISQIYISL